MTLFVGQQKRCECWYVVSGNFSGTVHILNVHLSPPPPLSSHATAKCRTVWHSIWHQLACLLKRVLLLLLLTCWWINESAAVAKRGFDRHQEGNPTKKTPRYIQTGLLMVFVTQQDVILLNMAAVAIIFVYQKNHTGRTTQEEQFCCDISGIFWLALWHRVRTFSKTNINLSFLSRFFVSRFHVPSAMHHLDQRQSWSQPVPDTIISDAGPQYHQLHSHTTLTFTNVVTVPGDSRANGMAQYAVNTINSLW